MNTRLYKLLTALGLKGLPGLVLLMGMLLTGCEKELDFKYHEIPAIPVAEIFLTQDGAYAKLTHTTPMGEALDTIPQTDATITITDLTDGTTLTAGTAVADGTTLTDGMSNGSHELIPGADGVFRAPLRGVPGHEYLVVVERQGKVATATGVMTPEVPIVGMEFSSYKMPYGDSGLLVTKFEDVDPAAGTCYWLRYLRNGEMWRWKTVTDHGAQEGIVSNIVMLGKIEEEPEDEDDLRDGDLVTVLVTQISRDFYDYLEAVSNDSNGPWMFAGTETLGFFLPGARTTATATFRLAAILP